MSTILYKLFCVCGFTLSGRTADATQIAYLEHRQFCGCVSRSIPRGELHLTDQVS